MFCPKCKSEYKEGFYKCADCGVDLVDKLPEDNIENKIQEYRETKEILKPKTITTYLNEVDANIALGLLEAKGINADIITDDSGGMRPSLPLFTGGYKVIVDERDIEKASICLKIIDSRETKISELTKNTKVVRISRLAIICFILLILFLIIDRIAVIHIKSAKKLTNMRKTPKVPYSDLLKGKQLVHEGKYHEAIKFLSKAIELDSKNKETYNLRGKAYRKIGKLEKAISDYTKIIELYPDYVKAYGNRGFIYLNKQDYNKAISDFTKAIELDSSYAYGYLQRGGIYIETGEYDKAISDFTKAIDLEPKKFIHYSLRGSSYNIIGSYEKAISDFNLAIELNPGGTDFILFDIARCYNNRGVAYFNLGRYKKAQKDVNKAIELGYDVHTEFLSELKSKVN